LTAVNVPQAFCLYPIRTTSRRQCDRLESLSIRRQS
jgi:hypothetical protein